MPALNYDFTKFEAYKNLNIDDVIIPHTTRTRICRSLEMLKRKKITNPWKKHDNIPL